MSIAEFEVQIQPLRAQAAHHPVIKRIQFVAPSNDALKTFTQIHVFAVWDFMTLLKSLQRRLTCVELPWLPPTNPQLARLINEIVLAEESDEVEPGRYLSHFELYLEGMREIGADTRPAESFVWTLRSGGDYAAAARSAKLSPAVQNFNAHTFAMSEAPIHMTAAAFLWGREDVVPEMFANALRESTEWARAPKLNYYLTRHIELDGGQHSAHAREMLSTLCGNDGARWSQALGAAQSSLRARIALWDATEIILREAALAR